METWTTFSLIETCPLLGLLRESKLDFAELVAAATAIMVFAVRQLIIAIAAMAIDLQA